MTRAQTLKIKQKQLETGLPEILVKYTSHNTLMSQAPAQKVQAVIDSPEEGAVAVPPVEAVVAVPPVEAKVTVPPVKIDVADPQVPAVVADSPEQVAVAETPKQPAVKSAEKLPVVSALAQLPPRIRGPHNKKFKPLQLIANHCFVNLEEQIRTIYIFKVVITPKIPHDNTKLREKLLNQKLKEISELIPNPVIGGFNIFSTRAPVATEKQYTYEDYSILIKQVKVYDILENPSFLLTFLNNSLRNTMNKLNYVEIGRSGKYFNHKQKINIENLIMYSGYKSNFVKLEKGYFLRIDPAKKIVRNQTVLDFIDSMYAVHKNKDKEERRQVIKAELIGKIVMSNYGKTQYYQVTDIQFKDIAEVRIENNMSLLEYYNKKYQIEIQKPKQPLLVSTMRNKQKTIYLIPELMLMTGIPDNFDEARRKRVSEQTIKDPNYKLKEITDLISKLKGAKELRNLQEMGINLNFKLQTFEAKQIPVPTLELGKNNTVDRGREAFFNLFNKPIYAAKHSIQCTIIHSKNVDVRQLIEIFQRTSKNLAVDLKISTSSYSVPNISFIEKEITKALQDDAKICCIVIPVSLKTSYKELKVLTLKQALVTQVVTQATLRKKNLQSVATKILLQIIAKRGNVLWVPKSKIELKPTMLVAFDRCKMGNKTLLAICATISSTFGIVYTRTKILTDAQDRFKTMTQLLSDALNAYRKRNQGAPDEIICFQNSCTRDQIISYQKLFVEPALKHMQQSFMQESIALTLIMVNVKPNERFFADKTSNATTEVTNVPAGTLVCKDLVSENYEFYIVSQQPTRGTTVPNHYKVIYSNSKLEQGIIQQLSFSQCFNYVNWTGSIKVPAILQYAKKAAKFGSELMSEVQIPEQLNTKMYFV